MVLSRRAAFASSAALFFPIAASAAGVGPTDLGTPPAEVVAAVGTVSALISALPSNPRQPEINNAIGHLDAETLEQIENGSIWVDCDLD